MALCAVLLVAGSVAAAHRRPVQRRLIPAASATPWMVDALPGIGAKTREEHVANVVAGRFDLLPRPARSLADQVFAPPGP